MRVRTRPSRTASGCFARTPPSSSMLQCVAVCCSVCYNVCVTMCCSICCSGLRAHHPPLASFSMLQCVAVCCSVLQCVAVYCSVLHCASQSVAACVAVVRTHTALLQHAAVCCRVRHKVLQHVLQWFARTPLSSSMLLCVAVREETYRPTKEP